MVKEENEEKSVKKFHYDASNLKARIKALQVRAKKTFRTAKKSFRERTHGVRDYIDAHPRMKRGAESLSRTRGLWVKELKVLSKDKFAMIIIFLLPVALILTIVSQSASGAGSRLGGIGGGGGGSGTAAPAESQQTQMQLPKIGLVDLDDSEGILGRDLSKELVDLFKDYAANRSQMELYVTDDPSELDEMIGKGQLNGYVVIPQQFEFNISIHFPGFIVVHIDTIDLSLLAQTQGVIDSLVSEYKQTNNFTGVFDMQITEENVPEKGKLLFQISPLFFPLVIFSIGALTSAQAIVSDVPKDRMVLTPANKFEITLSKFLANQTLMSILIIIMISMSMAFGLQIRGDVVSYFFFLFLIAASGVLWGLAISAVSGSPLAALQLFIFILLFHLIIVLFIPNEEVLAWIPMHEGKVVLTDVTLRGQSVWTVFDYIARGIVECFVLFIITYLVFKKKKSML
ncbi:MAG: ABC transporter permease [Promethearchaeota archaeon]